MDGEHRQLACSHRQLADDPARERKDRNRAQKFFGKPPKRVPKAFRVLPQTRVGNFGLAKLTNFFPRLSAITSV